MSNSKFSMLNSKTILLGVAVVLIISGLLVAQSFQGQPASVKAAVGPNELSGFAWSSNIGWISLNCTDLGACATSNYKVSINPSNKKFSGYGWAETIGWIDFGPLSGYPESPTYAAQISPDNQVEGWIQAVGNGDGWDGWIKLGDGGADNDWQDDDNAQVWFDEANCELRGFAWGGDVVGWIAFNSKDLPGSPSFAVQMPSGMCIQPVTADIKANGSDGPITVAPGETVTISWSSTNADSCSVAPTGWSGISGSQAEVILASTTYTVNCSNSLYSDSDSVTVNLSAAIDCSPDQQTVFIGESAALTASGGSGAYSWSAPQGDPSSGTGANFSTVYTDVGPKTVTVEDANVPGQSSICQVLVESSPVFEEQ